MNPSESGFTYAGKHSLRDFGCAWGEKDGRKFAPPVARSSYEIAGMSGTVLLPGVTRGETEYSGTLYLIREPRTMHEAAQRMREIAAWLCAGRDKLILDMEPERYYLAQVDDSPQWGWSGWFGGQVAVTFVLQPFAYNLHEDKTTVSVDVPTGPKGEFYVVRVRTGEPAPLRATVTNMTEEIITDVEISYGTQSAKFTGLTLWQGMKLRIDMEPPAGAVLLTYDDQEISSALYCAPRFDYIALPKGSSGVNIKVSGNGIGTANVEFCTRGRY